MKYGKSFLIKRGIIMKLQDKNEDLKINELVDLKINLKIFNKNNKAYKNKIIPLKILANIVSTSR